MLPEIKLYNTLNENSELRALMDEIRGHKTKEPLIYTNDIPQTLNFYKDAPMVRITFVQDRIESADDSDFMVQSTAEVDFWTRSLADSSKLTPLIRSILRNAGWFQFDNARKKDPDSSSDVSTQLYMNTIWVKSYPY